MFFFSLFSHMQLYTENLLKPFFFQIGIVTVYLFTNIIFILYEHQ